MSYNKAEVYSATRFSDLLASPTFYAMSAIAIILGFSSIFGFLQSPKKLKNAVDIIAKKVVVHKQSDIKARKLASVLAAINAQDIPNKHSDRNTASLLENRYSIFKDKFTNESKKHTSKRKRSIQTIQLASFDYDITSKHFWGNLDMNNPHETMLEESLLNNDSLLIGVPMTLDNLPETGDAKYSLRSNRNYL